MVVEVTAIPNLKRVVPGFVLDYICHLSSPFPQFPLPTLSSKRMWMVLCREGTNGIGRPRVEMYRSEDSVAGHQPQRVVDLEAVRSVKPVGEPPS